jgi:3-phosphoglycerate kinase
MSKKQTIYDMPELKGKVVIVRVDYNVPVNEFGFITDDYRIRQSLPTIEHLRSLGAKIVLISHLGRPVSKDDKQFSLAPVALRLKDLLHLPVHFVDDCQGPKAQKAVKELKVGGILLLENLRFYKEEESNDAKFAKNIASLGDYFVQDGFGVVHRAHASTSAITSFLPSYCGLLLNKEVTTIESSLKNPKRPLTVVIGGAKISDKIDLLKLFIQKADFVAVVGAMANIFLLAEGHKVGNSLIEKDAIHSAKEILKLAVAESKKRNFTFYLPEDVVVAKEIDSKSHTRVVDLKANTWADITSYPKQPAESLYTVQHNEIILDIGPISSAFIAGAIKVSSTVIWNGTAGVTEVKGWHGAADPFAHGTKFISSAMIPEKSGYKNYPFVVVGGGDTVGFVESVDGLREKLGFVSTGGGASLDLMAGKKLPGVEALLDSKS